MDQESRPGYARRHQAVRRTRGKARNHRCVHCSARGVYEPAADWAQIHGRDGTNPVADYMPLCKSCHTTYDKEVVEMKGGYAAIAYALNRRFLPQPAITSQQVYVWDKRRTRNMRGQVPPEPMEIRPNAPRTTPSRIFETEEWVAWFAVGTPGPHRKGWRVWTEQKPGRSVTDVVPSL